MFKKTAIAAAVGLTLSVGAQADYRWQLDGQAGRTNIDVGRDDGDVDQFGIGGRFYFDDVDTGMAVGMQQSAVLALGAIALRFDSFPSNAVPLVSRIR